MVWALTQRAMAKPTSETKLGRLGGDPSTWSTLFVVSVRPPIMSRWTVASVPTGMIGRAFSRAIVASISAGQMNRIVRSGSGSLPALIRALSPRAISRIPAQPLALSLAPGLG
jgi:hypothetical protein